MGFRYRDNDRYYGRPLSSREEEDFYLDRRGPPPSYSNRRPDDRRFMKEIATKALFLSAKKFYLDIVEGTSGKLLKLSEVSQTGQKSKMLMDLDIAVEFHDKISDFCDFLSTYEKGAERDRTNQRSEAIKNDTMVKDQRRYYLDLMENHRGVFLKVTMKPLTMERIQLVFPASGLPEVRDALTELLSEHGSTKKGKACDTDDCIVTDVTVGSRGAAGDEDPEAVIVVPDGSNVDDEEDEDDEDDDGRRGRKRVRAKREEPEEQDANKLNCRDRTFQFEVKTNDAGTYLSITESSSKFRSVVNVPQKCWKEFVTSVEVKLSEMKKSQQQQQAETEEEEEEEAEGSVDSASMATTQQETSVQ